MESAQRLRRAAELLNDGLLAVVHHWDTDGMASAAMILRKHGDQVIATMTPKIGFYSGESVEVVSVPKNADHVLFLDYGVDSKTYENLYRKIGKCLIVIDHHLVDPWNESGGSIFCNPVALGLGSEGEWPSTTFLLSKILKVEDEYDATLTALGIIGDLAPYIDAEIPHHGLKYARKLLDDTKVNVADLRRIAEILDSCYRIYDTARIDYAVGILASEGIEAIMDDD